MLEFGTIAGAGYANLDPKIGTLKPGKEADVLLRADDPAVWPVNNAPGTVANMMNPGHIDAVFIAGKVRKWQGKLIGVDMARVMHLTTEARDSPWRRAGPVSLDTVEHPVDDPGDALLDLFDPPRREGRRQ